jgi:hypothetical protein
MIRLKSLLFESGVTSITYKGKTLTGTQVDNPSATDKYTYFIDDADNYYTKLKTASNWILLDKTKNAAAIGKIDAWAPITNTDQKIEDPKKDSEDVEDETGDEETKDGEPVGDIYKTVVYKYEFNSAVQTSAEVTTWPKLSAAGYTLNADANTVPRSDSKLIITGWQARSTGGQPSFTKLENKIRENLPKTINPEKGLFVFKDNSDKRDWSDTICIWIRNTAATITETETARKWVSYKRDGYYQSTSDGTLEPDRRVILTRTDIEARAVTEEQTVTALQSKVEAAGYEISPIYGYMLFKQILGGFKGIWVTY